jgi:hypothetical protein
MIPWAALTSGQSVEATEQVELARFFPLLLACFRFRLAAFMQFLIPDNFTHGLLGFARDSLFDSFAWP